MMKIYKIKKEGWPDQILDVKNVDEAKSYIQWNYANSGDVELVVETYLLTNAKTITVKTNYGR